MAIREKTTKEAVIEADEPTREEQHQRQLEKTGRRPAGLAITPTGTGPHRPRTGAGHSPSPGYAFLSNARPSVPKRGGKRRTLIIIGAVVLLAAQGAAAVYLVKSKQNARDKIDPRNTLAGTGSGSAERPDAAKLYREAKELFAAGNRYAAMERLTRMQMLTKDEEILALAGALERRIEAANQMDQAQIQIKAGHWKEAAYHLQKVLSLDPNEEAQRLFKEANEKLGEAALPAPPPPKPIVLAEKKKKGGHKAPKVASVSIKPKAEPKIEPVKPKAEPKVEPPLPKVQPKAEPKVEPKVEPTPKAEPKVLPQPKPKVAPIPHLGLPKRSVAKVTDDAGKPTKQLSVVCKAVELVVSRALNRSAAGATGNFANHFYDKYKGNKAETMTLYPQVMGYLVADALIRNKSGIGARLIALQESGRLASMADSGWRP